MTTKDASTRRAFIRKTGAALSVPLAAATATVSASSDRFSWSAIRAQLDAIKAIQALNDAWARHLNAGSAEALATLFADPSNASIDPSIRGVTPDGFYAGEYIRLHEDGETATEVLRCVVQIESAIGPDCPLLDMARQQGGGVVTCSEKGFFDQAYVKRDGVWKIERSVYRRAEASASA